MLGGEQSTKHLLAPWWAQAVLGGSTSRFPPCSWLCQHQKGCKREAGHLRATECFSMLRDERSPDSIAASNYPSRPN